MYNVLQLIMKKIVFLFVQVMFNFAFKPWHKTTFAFEAAIRHCTALQENCSLRLGFVASLNLLSMHSSLSLPHDMP